MTSRSRGGSSPEGQGAGTEEFLSIYRAKARRDSNTEFSPDLVSLCMLATDLSRIGLKWTPVLDLDNPLAPRR
jgi:hypothetical protein